MLDSDAEESCGARPRYLPEPTPMQAHLAACHGGFPWFATAALAVILAAIAYVLFCR